MRPKPATALQSLLATLPQQGRVEWIGLRPARRVAPIAVERADIGVGQGLLGDRFSGVASSKRQVTLMQQEHLLAVGGYLGQGAIDPRLTRRNIVVSGINLLALRRSTFRLGTALLQGTGPCAPCSRMEEHLGPGGYNAMRGHGGITARVLEAGVVVLGDRVVLVAAGALAAGEED
jgi:MOSC domain-containing protein YiiM